MSKCWHRAQRRTARRDFRVMPVLHGQDSGGKMCFASSRCNPGALATQTQGQGAPRPRRGAPITCAGTAMHTGLSNDPEGIPATQRDRTREFKEHRGKCFLWTHNNHLGHKTASGKCKQDVWTGAVDTCCPTCTNTGCVGNGLSVPQSMNSRSSLYLSRRQTTTLHLPGRRATLRETHMSLVELSRI